MPRYDYACHECGHRFEAVHPITSEALSVCPECGGTLRRVIGAVGVSFKGSGFYHTDTREAARKVRAKATPASSSAPSATTPSTAPSTASPSTAEAASAAPARKPATAAAAKTPAASSGSDS